MPTSRPKRKCKFVGSYNMESRERDERKRQARKRRDCKKAAGSQPKISSYQQKLNQLAGLLDPHKELPCDSVIRFAGAVLTASFIAFPPRHGSHHVNIPPGPDEFTRRVLEMETLMKNHYGEPGEMNDETRGTEAKDVDTVDRFIAQILFQSPSDEQLQFARGVIEASTRIFLTTSQTAQVEPSALFFSRFLLMVARSFVGESEVEEHKDDSGIGNSSFNGDETEEDDQVAVVDVLNSLIARLYLGSPQKIGSSGSLEDGGNEDPTVGMNTTTKITSSEGLKSRLTIRMDIADTSIQSSAESILKKETLKVLAVDSEVATQRPTLKRKSTEVSEVSKKARYEDSPHFSAFLFSSTLPSAESFQQILEKFHLLSVSKTDEYRFIRAYSNTSSSLYRVEFTATGELKSKLEELLNNPDGEEMMNKEVLFTRLNDKVEIDKTVLLIMISQRVPGLSLLSVDKLTLWINEKQLSISDVISLYPKESSEAFKALNRRTRKVLKRALDTEDVNRLKDRDVGGTQLRKTSPPTVQQLLMNQTDTREPRAT